MLLQIEKKTMAFALLISAVLMSVASICFDESHLRRAMVRTVASLATPSNDQNREQSESGVVSARGTEANRILQSPSVSRARIFRSMTEQRSPQSRVCKIESEQIETTRRPTA